MATDQGRFAALYVGAKFHIGEDAEHYYGDPSVMFAPVKDPAKNLEKRNDVQQWRQTEEAATIPVVGTLEEICVLDDAEQTLFTLKSQAPGRRGDVALPFVRWLMENYGEQFADSVRFADAVPQVLIFGLGIKDALRVTAAEVMRHNATATVAGRLLVPVRLWHNPLGVYDPLNMLLTTEHDRKTVPLGRLLAYVKSPVDCPRFELLNAVERAQVARDLTQRFQIVSPTI